MTEARGWSQYFLKLSRIIPGMKGYQDKEAFRDTDKAVRVAVAGKLGDVKKALNDAKRDLVDNRKIADIEYIDRAHRRVQRIQETIRYDSYGYSGYFDPQLIREPELEQMYQFDMGLFDDVERLMGLAQKIRGSQDIKAATQALEKGMDDFEGLLKKRRDFQVPSGKSPV
jgi:hypothetical protein